MFVFRERLAAIYNRQVEEDVEVRKILEMKKAAIADAEKRQDEPLDDSKLVDVIFDFLPRSDSVNEQAAPTAFKGLRRFLMLHTYKLFVQWLNNFEEKPCGCWRYFRNCRTIGLLKYSKFEYIGLVPQHIIIRPLLPLSGNCKIHKV